MARRRAKSFLLGSACRHADRTVSSPASGVAEAGLGVQSLRIPFGFLLIVRTGQIFTARLIDERVLPDSRMFQHIAKFKNGHITNRYSYGRRLPGLNFEASGLPPDLST